MSLSASTVDPLFFRHELMLELGRLDFYIASVDAQSVREHEARNDDPRNRSACIEEGAVALRARIHESLSAVPV